MIGFEKVKDRKFGFIVLGGVVHPGLRRLWACLDSKKFCAVPVTSNLAAHVWSIKVPFGRASSAASGAVWSRFLPNGVK